MQILCLSPLDSKLKRSLFLNDIDLIPLAETENQIWPQSEVPINYEKRTIGSAVISVVTKLHVAPQHTVVMTCLLQSMSGSIVRSAPSESK
jgi:hypothetical protein